jgi:hypothetical protein
VVINFTKGGVMNTKLQADYAELAHQYLDNIPIEKEQDFEIIAEALKSITEPTVSHTVPQNLEGRIKTLKDIVDNPDLYVQDSQNYNQFTKIIIGRVAAKINEIQNLNPEEKQKYIADQKKVKEGAMANQEIMSGRQAPAPDSEAHVISEQQLLQEIESQFQQEPIQNAQQASLLDLNRIQGEMDRLRERLNQLRPRADLVRQAAEVQARLQRWQNQGSPLVPMAQLEWNQVANARTERLEIETRLANLGMILLRLQFRNEV